MTDDVAAHLLAPPHSLGIEAAPGMSGWGDALRRRLGYGGRSRVLAVIPARWASTRFPGKPLALIDGKPMIQVRRVRGACGFLQQTRCACVKALAADALLCLRAGAQHTWEQARQAATLSRVGAARRRGR
jgi:hypothetical protein